MITFDQLKAIAPYALKSRLSTYVTYINAAMSEFGITTTPRITAFLSQLAHESGSFNYMEEIASGDAYDTRTDLGNTPEVDGDGRKYKGRGPIQITGRKNYELVSKALGVDFVNNPELLELPEYGFRAAAWFWKYKGLNDIADKPETWTTLHKGRVYTKIQWITKVINGEQNGIDDRTAFYKKAKEVIK